MAPTCPREARTTRESWPEASQRSARRSVVVHRRRIRAVERTPGTAQSSGDSLRPEGPLPTTPRGYLELVTTENRLSRHKCLDKQPNGIYPVDVWFGRWLGSEFFLRPTASPALPRFGAFKQCGSLRRRHNGAETIHRRYFLQHPEGRALRLLRPGWHRA